MERRALAIAFKNNSGTFTPFEGDVVGKVLGNGTVEGTDYRFDPTKINGGVAITRNSSLEIQEDGSLRNPATGDVFTETKKRTGYYSQKSKVFVKVWNTQENV